MCSQHGVTSFRRGKQRFYYGDTRGDARSWARIIAEARKCALVCNRCHKEIHEGLVSIPPEVPLFNEKFADYKNIVKKELLSPCSICGKSKPKQYITCSRSCSAKKSRRVNWDNVDLLFLLKIKTRVAIADELGVSEAAVRKREKKILLGGAQNGIGPSC